MALTFERNLEMVKVNKQAKYLGQGHFIQKLISGHVPLFGGAAVGRWTCD